MQQSILAICPLCGAALEGTSEDFLSCVACRSEAEFRRFPASRQTAILPRASSLSGSGEAQCYFHEMNAAVAPCDQCGRFVCTLCQLPWGNRQLCPVCLSAVQADPSVTVQSRFLPERAAFACGILSFVFPPTFVFTAPAAVFLGIWSLRSPGSLVRPARWRAIVAIVLGSLIIGGFIWLMVYASMLPRTR